MLVALGLAVAVLGAAAKPRADVDETAPGNAPPPTDTMAGPVTATDGTFETAPRPAEREALHVPVFATGLALLVVGVGLRNVARRKRGTPGDAAAGQPVSAGARAETAVGAMRQLHDGVRKLLDDFSGLSQEELLARLDAMASGYVLVIGEHGAAVAERLGPGAFAEMMALYALGERQLNRAWTSTADGYVDEALESLRAVGPALGEAVAMMERAVYGTRERSGPPAPG